MSSERLPTNGLKPGLNSTRRIAIQHPDYQPPSVWRKLVGWNLLGVVLVVGALVVSVSSVLAVRARQNDPTKRIVRIMHWQLELGYREALDQVIASYNELKRQEYLAGKTPQQVEVQQVAITEKVYKQVEMTNLIAGTAPDIFAANGDRNLLIQYQLPLDSYVAQPNPYNAEDYTRNEIADPALRKALATRPWTETFIDGARGGFYDEFQSQIAISAHFTPDGRIAFNLDLLQKITGSDTIPATFGELLAMAAKTKDWARQTGQKEVCAIAASKSNDKYFNRDLAAQMLGPWWRAMDLDHDGTVTEEEGWATIGMGRVSFRDQTYRDYIAAATAIAGAFPSGFSGMERDQSMFLFTQQKAPAMFCASWDAGAVLNKAKEKGFRVAFVSAPPPGPGEPWSDPPKSVITEADATAFASYTINKAGHYAEAIDFMRYWTSYVQNQRFNRKADWIPNIIGTSPSPTMAAYAPRIAGMPFSWNPGDPWPGMYSRTNTVLQGQLFGVLSGEMNFERFIAAVEESYTNPNYGEPQIWKDLYLNARTSTRNTDRNLAGLQVLAVLDPATMTTNQRKVRDLLWGQMPGNGGMSVQWRWRTTVGAVNPDHPQGKPFPEIDR